jgi:hypothetical protein
MESVRSNMILFLCSDDQKLIEYRLKQSIHVEIAGCHITGRSNPRVVIVYRIGIWPEIFPI